MQHEEINTRKTFTFRMHTSTIGGIIPEVCQAVYHCLKSEYLRLPNTKEEWKKISQKNAERWRFPNCFGAVDGKHILILHPKNSGFDYYNYKGFLQLSTMTTSFCMLMWVVKVASVTEVCTTIPLFTKV